MLVYMLRLSKLEPSPNACGNGYSTAYGEKNNQFHILNQALDFDKAMNSNEQFPRREE
jgi:hypothetical protein